MKHFELKFISAAALVLSLLQVVAVVGQCPTTPIKLEHTSGTVSYECTDVTVSSSGAVNAAYPLPCSYGPYWIGYNASGSFTFTFSSPVQAISMNVANFDNLTGFAVEEMVIDVNGAFYPLTSPGTPDGCLQPAIIWPPGTLRGPIDGDGGSAKDLYIPGPIYTLKIADNFVVGNALGISLDIFFCCYDCNTDAGEINTNDFEACIGKSAVVPPSSQVVLDADDLLQYILFSDAGNPTTSTLATSNSPSFSFNSSTMAVGTTYYIAAIAGNEMNGNVDVSDPCLDISNIIQVIWRPEPTVAFASDADCLQPGGCYDIALSFEGTPPFYLTGQVVSGGNVITNFGGIYNFDSEIMLLCLPSTTPNGPVTLEALSLSDVHCTCN